MCGIRTSHAVTRLQAFDFNGESSKLRHIRKRPGRGDISIDQAQSASLLVAHTSQTNALLVLDFELFFDSLGDKIKKSASFLSPRSTHHNVIYARDMTPQARILLSV